MTTRSGFVRKKAVSGRVVLNLQPDAALRAAGQPFVFHSPLGVRHQVRR